MPRDFSLKRKTLDVDMDAYAAHCKDAADIDMKIKAYLEMVLNSAAKKSKYLPKKTAEK